MGRNRTPTALMEARGAYTRHPERRAERANEPQDTRPVGGAPAYFDDDMRNCWDEIVSMAAPGVLTGGDRGLVEAAARLLDELRQLTEEVVTKDGAVITIRKAVRSGDVTAFHRCLSTMGLTPTDRAKVSIPKPSAAKSNFDKLQ